MNIHEYQAKKLLGSYGLPVAKGIMFETPPTAEAIGSALLGPVYVVKAQIHAGGRGKGHFLEDMPEQSGGGVRLCASPEDAAKTASEMLNRTLVTKQTGPQGRRVRRVYIEEGSKIEKELYLSVLIDRKTARVTFVASREGGVDIETVAEKTPEKIAHIAVDPVMGFMPHHARALARALGLGTAFYKPCFKIGSALYRAYNEKDMNLLEINPLILSTQGDLLVLDCKMGFDENALYRHADIVALRDINEEDALEIEASKHDLAYIKLQGTIGCMVNGAGLAMATMDIIDHYGARPANFLDVGGGASKEKVKAAFSIITRDPAVKGVLVNIFGGIMRCDVIAQAIVEVMKDMDLLTPLVVRLEGTRVDEGKRLLRESGLTIIPADDLDDAARRIVAAVGA